LGLRLFVAAAPRRARVFPFNRGLLRVDAMNMPNYAQDCCEEQKKEYQQQEKEFMHKDPDSE